MPPASSPPLSDRPILLRQYLATLKLDGFIITRGDEYLGEYVAPYAERLAWLTGFTGSAGIAILLGDTGCVFSDGRYTVQMDEQVPHVLWERRHIALDPPQAWLAQHATGMKIGFDPWLVSQSQYQAWQCKGITLVPVTENPIDAVWSDQPAPPAEEIMPHPMDYAGESSASKRHRLAEQLRTAGQNAMLMADCTSLMWLLNIRSHDVPMTPLAHGHGVLHDDGTVDYFAEPHRLAASLDDGVRLHPPTALEEYLTDLKGRTIRLDPATTPLWFTTILEQHGAHVTYGPDLCTLPKAIKNPVEQEGNREAHRLDGLALARFLHWVETHGVGLSETALAARLEAFRAQNASYRGPSFETISAVGPNGAYPHYRAEAGHDRVLTENSVYLVDSGGQYSSGTTDITRTLWIGPDEPFESLKDAYTRVLKGNIALSCLRFPAGTPGYRLDVMARAALWKAGMDYDHGTGHGIGSYLSVHEGPQSISPAPRPVGLEAGMIVSNEPGYYAIGKYGIRIENLLLVRPASIAGTQDKAFLEFEVLSFTPIDRRLIQPALLTTEEWTWLDTYHAEVERHLLSGLEEALHPWVKQACAPLQVCRSS